MVKIAEGNVAMEGTPAQIKMQLTLGVLAIIGIEKEESMDSKERDYGVDTKL